MFIDVHTTMLKVSQNKNVPTRNPRWHQYDDIDTCGV